MSGAAKETVDSGRDTGEVVETVSKDRVAGIDHTPTGRREGHGDDAPVGFRFVVAPDDLLLLKLAEQFGDLRT
jgi:hypothetical protein